MPTFASSSLISGSPPNQGCFDLVAPAISKVMRQLPETEMLHVPARSPVSWWVRQPGGPSNPSIVSTLSKAVRTRRTRATRSRLMPLSSSSSIKRFSPLCRTLRLILMPWRVRLNRTICKPLSRKKIQLHSKLPVSKPAGRRLPFWLVAAPHLIFPYVNGSALPARGRRMSGHR